MKNTLKQKNEHVTKAAGVEVFLIPQNQSSLASCSVKDHPSKSESIQERSLTKLAPWL